MQAGQALVWIDFASGVNGLNKAFIGAGLAGAAAFLVAFEPVKHADPAGDRQRGSQGAQIAAIETFDEQSGA